MGNQVATTSNGQHEVYELHLDAGYVLVPDGISLTSRDVNKLTMSLLTVGYRLCDPFDVEPEHVAEGVRFFVTPQEEEFAWS